MCQDYHGPEGEILSRFTWTYTASRTPAPLVLPKRKRGYADVARISKPSLAQKGRANGIQHSSRKMKANKTRQRARAPRYPTPFTAPQAISEGGPAQEDSFLANTERIAVKADNDAPMLGDTSIKREPSVKTEGNIIQELIARLRQQEDMIRALGGTPEVSQQSGFR